MSLRILVSADSFTGFDDSQYLHSSMYMAFTSQMNDNSSVLIHTAVVDFILQLHIVVEDL
jgi:hypothetical protein